MMMLIGGWIFVSSHKHLLIMLLSLEVMMLSLFGIMSWMMVEGMGDEYILLIFLSFGVCEGSLGLGLLVMMVRIYGSDYFSNLSSLWD